MNTQPLRTHIEKVKALTQLYGEYQKKGDTVAITVAREQLLKAIHHARKELSGMEQELQ